MRVSYDIDEINDLSVANLSVSRALAPVAGRALLDAVEFGLSDVAALITTPASLVRLRHQLGVVVGDAGDALATTATLSAQIYYQAASYLAAEMGLPVAAIIARQTGRLGVRAGKAVAEDLEDLYFGPIHTTELTAAEELNQPDEILDIGLHIGGSYGLITGRIEVTYEVQRYGDTYRVIMRTKIFGGVGSSDVNVGGETTVELSWDVSDPDSARRLIARLGILTGPQLAAMLVALSGSEVAALLAETGVALTGALLRIPVPSKISYEGGIAGHVGSGGDSAAGAVVSGVEIVPGGSGIPVTPYAKVAVDGEFLLPGEGQFKGSVSVTIDPDEITIELDGRFLAGPAGGGAGGHGVVGVGLEARGILHLPIGVLDPRLVARLRMGDPRALMELFERLEGASGSIAIYGDAGGEGDIGGGPVSGGGHVIGKKKLSVITFGG